MSESVSNLPWITNLSIDQVLDAFKNTHALLLTGPEAIGKSHLAAQACKALFMRSSEHQTIDLIKAGTHPDLHVLTSAYSYNHLDSTFENVALRYLDAEALEKKRLSRQIGVDSIRSLISNMSEASALGGYKLAVIYPAEDLNKNSANALLKFLEEPTDQTLILMISHDISRLPATIRSRCVQLAIALPDPDLSKQWLHQSYSETNQIDAALTLAANRPLLANQYLQDNRQQMVNSLIKDIEQLVATDNVNIVSIARKWTKLKQTGFILNWLCRLFSDLIKIKSTDADFFSSISYKSELRTISVQLSMAKLFEIYDYFVKINQRYDGVTDEALLIEDLVLMIKRGCVANG